MLDLSVALDMVKNEIRSFLHSCLGKLDQVILVSVIGLYHFVTGEHHLVPIPFSLCIGLVDILPWGQNENLAVVPVGFR